MIEINEILPILSIGTLTKIKNKCEYYISHTIEYKQVNTKYGVKTRAKDYAELLDLVVETIALKQFEEQANSTKNGESNNNVTSTMSDSQITPVESKKKEKKS